MNVKEGDLFHGRYRIISLLGEGSVGTVFRATQIDSGREVALKLLHGTGSAASKDRERFLREFKILAQLTNDHIVTFYSAALSPEGVPYAVFEYINGADLHHIVDREQKLPFPRVLKIAEQVCLAMDYAHGQGIIHRDLKPENIMLLDKPEPDFVKILDFGLARDITPSSGKQSLTATGMVVGTVCYLSPEQCKGGKASVQSDIYALACIIYECISGQLLFEADSPLGVVQKQIFEDPLPALNELDDLVPEVFINVMKKALSKDPAKRHQTMQELYSDLQSLPREKPRGFRRLSRRIAAGVACVLLLGLIGVGIMLVAGKGSFALFKKDGEDSLHSSRISRLLSVQSPETLMREAKTLIEQRDFNSADQRLKLAMEKSLRSHDQNDVFRCELLMTRSALKDGDTTTARQRAEHAVSTAKKYFGKESSQYFKAQRTLADAVRNVDPSLARSITRDLLKQWQSANKPADKDLLELLADYIQMLHKSGADSEAEQELAGFRRLFESADIDPQLLVEFLCLQAQNKYQLKKDGEADAFVRPGLELADKAVGLKLDDRIYLLAIWSRMFFDVGRRDEAIRLIQTAESRASAPGFSSQLVGLYIGEANMLLMCNEPSKALSRLEKAYLIVHPRTMPKPNALLSEVCFAKANCYLNLNQLDNSLHCLDEAMAICPEDAGAILIKCNNLRKKIEQIKAKK